jgi:GNAT superfamily N-acetyltransferase
MSPRPSSTEGTSGSVGELRRRVLAEAAVAFAGVPGIEVTDEGDLVRSMAPGVAQPYVNTIARLALDTEGFDARVRAVETPYRDAGLPTAWWVDDDTGPGDAFARLEALGLRPSGGEAVMVLDLEGPTPAVEEAARAAERGGIRVERVGSRARLEDWIAVMGGAYGWSDPAKEAAMRRLYDPEAPHGRDGRRVQVLAALGGTPVGAASLFQAAGQGWVTNVGTVPAARGRGVGAAVTAATLAVAREQGHATAWLAASEMGEPVYRRLGFVTVGRLRHLSGPAPAG